MMFHVVCIKELEVQFKCPKCSNEDTWRRSGLLKTQIYLCAW